MLWKALDVNSQPVSKPVINTASPWTYWWWQGNAVNKSDILSQLERFKTIGIGGAHIIPIYGVKGEESHFLSYLSNDWIDIFNFTCSEATKLGIGIDLSTGTGWPFGGPKVTIQNCAKQIVFHDFSFADTLKINEILERSIYKKADIFICNSPTEFKPIKKVILYNNLKNKRLNKYLIVTYEPTNQMVKRAAPGGEGLVVDHFDANAISQYLSAFDLTLLAKDSNCHPRAMYNDSYEVYKANWTTSLFSVFKLQHNYDIEKIIYVVSPGYPACQFKEKVITDFRETLSFLLYNSQKKWADWINHHKMISRYQAHGAPGNLLDLYALADIPETESFGSSSFNIPNVRTDPDYSEKNFGRPHPLMMKFASSPANFLGKKLVASESTTWLGNHFKVALSQIKPQLDELFIAGINHIYFHGTTYSPKNEPFPGWLFYASTNYGSHSHFNNELPLLNSYIKNCQELLQESQPDNDLLLYLPIFDYWSDILKPLLLQFSVHHAGDWFLKTPCGKLSSGLWEAGFSFDYVSDLQIRNLNVNSDHLLSAGKNNYQTIIIPSSKYMTLETLSYLYALSVQGGHIIFDKSLPLDLPGIGRNSQKSQFDKLKKKLANNPNVYIGNADSILINLNIRHETLIASGLNFIRKKSGNEKMWFITNLSNRFLADSISLTGNAGSLEYYNPMNNDSGFISFENSANCIKTKIYLPPGSSCFLRSSTQVKEGKPFAFHYPTKDSIELTNWNVKFLSGLPSIPAGVYRPKVLTSWTTWSDSTLQSFNGYGSYSANFELPPSWINSKGVYLNIEDLRETANVTINNKEIGTIWAVPYQIFIPASRLDFNARNTVILNVRNLSANQIRNMDLQHRYWKKFYDANILDINYKPFDASKWEPVPSGILGKIKIINADNQY